MNPSTVSNHYDHMNIGSGDSIVTDSILLEPTGNYNYMDNITLHVINSLTNLLIFYELLETTTVLIVESLSTMIRNTDAGMHVWMVSCNIKKYMKL